MTIEQMLRNYIMHDFGSLSKLAHEAELPYTTVVGMLERGIGNARISNVFKLCDTLGIDSYALLNGKIEKRKISDLTITLDEQQHIKKYRALDEHGKEITDYILDKEYERSITIREPMTTYSGYSCMKSYIGARLSAGTGQFVFDDVPTDLIEVPIEFDYIDFVIEVSGNSMEPDYYDGDKVMIVKQPQINVGEIGAFMIDGEAYIKELGTDRLISHNKEYDDIIFNESMRIDCIGKVVGKL